MRSCPGGSSVGLDRSDRTLFPLARLAWHRQNPSDWKRRRFANERFANEGGGVPPLPRRYRSGEPALDPLTRLSSRATISVVVLLLPSRAISLRQAGRPSVGGRRTHRLLSPLSLPSRMLLVWMRRVVADKTAHPPARLRFAVRCCNRRNVGLLRRYFVALGPPEAIPSPSFRSADHTRRRDRAPAARILRRGGRPYQVPDPGGVCICGLAGRCGRHPHHDGEIKRQVKQQTSVHVMTTSMPF
jgi:hypothetical protein